MVSGRRNPIEPRAADDGADDECDTSAYQDEPGEGDRSVAEDEKDGSKSSNHARE